VGLTGGIGSGKSTVSTLLAERGAVIVDVDQLGRTVIAPGERAEAGVLAEFGPGVANEHGHIDRPSLAKTVFGNPEALARLTAISHPAINAELADRLDELPRSAIVVLDMAILVESFLGRGDPAHSYTRVVTVEAPIELRVDRAVARGSTRTDVQARMRSQASDSERRAVADVVITNDGTLDDLTRQVDELWVTLRRWAGTTDRA
jgi:dephospho-CoA kinase